MPPPDKANADILALQLSNALWNQSQNCCFCEEELEHRLKTQMRYRRSGRLGHCIKVGFATLVRLCALFVGFATRLLDPVTGFVHVFLPCETVGAAVIVVLWKDRKSIGERAAANILWGSTAAVPHDVEINFAIQCLHLTNQAASPVIMLGTTSRARRDRCVEDWAEAAAFYVIAISGSLAWGKGWSLDSDPRRGGAGGSGADKT